MSTLVAVIDYGMGNLFSVARALEHVAPPATRIAVTGEAEVIRGADRVVFPGQGAIRDCMRELERRDLRDVVLRTLGQRPFLGICLGLQALFEGSEEAADTAGLGVLEGRVRRFAPPSRGHEGPRFKVPHMGWNQVWRTRAHPLWTDIEDGARFYFVHSFHAPFGSEASAAYTDYACRFTSAVARDRLFAVQFHPEKSQRAGLTLLANFLRWDGRS